MDEIEPWAYDIWEATPETHDWMAQRFIRHLRAHKAKYPTFRPERVAALYVIADEKMRKYYCYAEISKLTKRVHAVNRLMSLADSQS